jgi:hypothetical protein
MGISSKKRVLFYFILLSLSAANRASAPALASEPIIKSDSSIN